MNFKTIEAFSSEDDEKKELSFLVLGVKVKIITPQISLSLPPEGAEVGHVILIQA